MYLDDKKLSTNVNKLAYHTNQHIYLIDPGADIKEGDWVYSWETIIKWNSQKQGTISLTEYSKIICSTDKYLGWTNIGTCEKGRIIGNKVNGSNRCLFEPILPQLSEQAIKLFIDYYNENGKMPDEINIEMINNLHTHIPSGKYWQDESVIMKCDISKPDEYIKVNLKEQLILLFLKIEYIVEKKLRI